jgi:cytochrome P450
MSRLVEAEDQGDRLTEDEMWTTCVTLFGAGHETTKNLTGNALLCLLRNPAQMREVRERPELIDGAIEEALRYESPTQAPPARVALEDVKIRGMTIRAGQAVTALLGAANRDPDHFENPDRFDIHRADNDHLAFSFGARYCLGAPLARAEAQIAVGTIVRRMPRLELATDNLQWQKADRFRGLKSLPVKF